MPLHGTAFWPGLRTGAVSCSYTCGHGPTPGVASLVIPFQPVGTLAQRGTLRMWDGVNRPLTLRGCRVVSAERVQLADGTPGLAVMIEDRRWRWRYGGVSGFHNQTDPDPDPSTLPDGSFVTTGGPYIPGTERTPVQLLAACLDALGERYAFFGVPSAARIPVDWRGVNPARAAADVADAVGCRLIYQPWADRAIVSSLGGFVKLPSTLPVIDDHPGISTPPGPTQISVLGGPSLIGDFVKLQAVGYEPDGSIRPIEELSYRPADGWWNYVPGYHYTNVRAGDAQALDDAKALAKQYVWRLFRVAGVPVERRAGIGGGKGPLTIKFVDFPAVRNRRQIELMDRLYSPEKDASGQYMSEPPRAYSDGYHGYTNRTGNMTNANAPTRLHNPFTIDPARGLVTFSKPVFRVWPKDTNGASSDEYDPLYGQAVATKAQYKLANVYLWTSLRVRHPASWQLVSGGAVYRVGGADEYGERPVVLSRPDLVSVRKVTRRFDTDFRVQKVSSNEREMQAAALAVAAAEAIKYQVSETASRTYAGIHVVDPDGGIQQVTWSIGVGQPPTTTVGVNTEHAAWLPAYAERRRNERAGVLDYEFVRQTLNPRGGG